MNRNQNSYFSTLPSADIPRSKVFKPYQHKTTFNAGELIPIFYEEILPGSTYSIDMSSLVRMTTPIFPTMDNAFLDTYFFFVPNRLLWEHWKEFMGENTQGPWVQTVEYEVPQLKTDMDPFVKGSIGDYFGLPTNVLNLSVNALPFRAYTLIWNEWFRDQNTMYPAYFSKDDSSRHVPYVQPDGPIEDRLETAIDGGMPLPVAKFHDYFTSTLPQPQKGPAVDLPLYQDKIPVFTGEENENFMASNYPGITFYGSNVNGQTGLLGYKDLGGNHVYQLGMASDNVQRSVTGSLVPNNLYADVSQVAVATISQLRQAFQLQRLFERDARGGTRYRELLQSHFSVTSPDARQQVPEYLGGKRVPINIDQVLQTSATNDVTPQGNTAAYSMTSDISNLFTKSFTEHGWIIGLCCVRTEHTYQQGIERCWSRKNRFDYYWPALAHISEQAVLVKEIYAEGNEHDDDAFGYQEAWAEYRYKPSRVTGAFRSNYAQTLDSWHYADYYTGGNDNFVLSPEFLCETKNNIDRTLAVSSSVEDQFLADFYLKMDCVLPMPLYSVPGLIDHY